jgi:hypothetical protein
MVPGSKHSSETIPLLAKETARLATAECRNRPTTAGQTAADAPLWIVCGSVKIEVRQPFKAELLQAVTRAQMHN